MSDWKADFPNTKYHYCEERSPRSTVYNCIGYAIGNTRKFFWPTPYVLHYWPSDIIMQESIAAFAALFAKHGYVVTKGPELEAGYEKIALYADDGGVPTHAARQAPDGLWLSKLGRGVDIKHALEALCGSEYGSPVRFYKRLVR
jgi:hypothetical protein